MEEKYPALQMLVLGHFYEGYMGSINELIVNVPVKRDKAMSPCNAPFPLVNNLLNSDSISVVSTGLHTF